MTQVVASVERGHGVDVDDLIGPGLIVVLCIRFRTPEDPQSFKVDALDEVWTLDVQNGDYSDSRHENPQPIIKAASLKRQRAMNSLTKNPLVMLILTSIYRTRKGVYRLPRKPNC